jgi:hypothetical protein
LGIARLFREVLAHMRRNDWRGAGACFYVAQLRLRTLATLDAQDKALVGLLAAVHEALGRPVDEWLGGDVRDWVGVIDGALRWDRAHAFEELAQFALERGRSADDAERAWQATRKALETFRRSILARRAELYASRRAAGLPVRDGSASAAGAPGTAQNA